MTVLRNYHDAGDSANVSGLDTFSLEREFSPNKMYTRYRRRRRVGEKISDLHANAVGGTIIRPIRKSHSSRRTRTGSAAMRERDESVAVAERERRCMNNDSWLHNGWNFTFSFSSSTSPPFHDNLDWPIFMLFLTLVFTVSDACSTRPSPKPRPPRPLWTPDLGSAVVKENCTDDYAELYCMNSGKCYRQKILETFIVNCECQPGFVGTRCQYRDVPDKYLPVQQQIQTASIAGGVSVLIIIVTVFLLAWLYFKRRRVSGSSSAGHV